MNHPIVILAFAASMLVSGIAAGICIAHSVIADDCIELGLAQIDGKYYTCDHTEVTWEESEDFK